MQIHGLEKLSLVDFNDLPCATVFTGYCNFRCPFCHNAALVLDPASQPLVAEEEVFSYLARRRGILDGVCVTGGEPTLQPDLADFLRKVKELGFLTKLDTNGSRPDVLRALVEQHLVDYVAMDIKNSFAKYGVTAGFTELAPVKESIAYLLRDTVPYEFRTTLVAQLHTAEDFSKISQAVAGCHRFYLQKFTDKGGCIAQNLTEVPEQEARAWAEILAKTVDCVKLRGY